MGRVGHIYDEQTRLPSFEAVQCGRFDSGVPHIEAHLSPPMVVAKRIYDVDVVFIETADLARRSCDCPIANDRGQTGRTRFGLFGPVDRVYNLSR